uniref:ACYPI006103 protein n=1 Tax=Acyrthosiphon pisum TaxID=7029 RepID=C4WWP2_ACYPI|nr:ACYPI006103 [Acyrthosiphon pisum]
MINMEKMVLKEVLAKEIIQTTIHILSMAILEQHLHSSLVHQIHLAIYLVIVVVQCLMMKWTLMMVLFECHMDHLAWVLSGRSHSMFMVHQWDELKKKLKTLLLNMKCMYH